MNWIATLSRILRMLTKTNNLRFRNDVFYTKIAQKIPVKVTANKKLDYFAFVQLRKRNNLVKKLFYKYN